MNKLKQHTRLISSAVVVALGLSACGGGGGSAPAPAAVVTCGAPSTATLPVTHVTSSINSATTWNTGNVYVVDGSISVNDVLTIQAGAVVKFATGVPGGTNLTVSSTGSINANGGTTGSVVFTSYLDDSAGGDSNGDAGATTPQVKDWGKVVLNASGSTFNCSQFSYGGKTNSTLEVGGAYSATITHSTFSHNNGGSNASLVTVATDAVGALDAGSATAATVITGNTFFDNIVPVSVSGLFSVDDSNSFHDPAVSSTTNKYNGIFLVGNSYKPITGTITFSETEVPFVLAGVVDVYDSSVLTIGNDVVFKFFASDSTLNTNYNGNVTGSTAKIVASASAGHKIVFTSYKDDSHGGDTNGDGASTGSVGDWARVVLNADGSLFNRAEFYYGGWDSANRETLALNAYSATVTNSIFAHNHGGDISNLPYSQYGTLNASRATAATTITGNTFYSNNIPMEISGNFNLDNSNVFHDPTNAATTNTYNGIFFTGNSANYFQTISLAETKVPFVIVGDIWVQAGKTLTLSSNVVFKFGSALSQLSYDDVVGNIVNINGAIFTSINDDSYLGDTNGNGASSGGANDWNGIRNLGHTSYIHPAHEFFNAN